MRNTVLMAALIAFGFSQPSIAADSLTSKAQTAQQQEKAHSSEREAKFKQEEQTLAARKAELESRKAQLEASIESLSNAFSDNERTLAEQQKKLHLETGSLGELFGVVRQSAKELQVELEQSVANTEQPEQIKAIDDIVAAKKLPSIQELTGLWNAYQAQIASSATYADVKVPFVNGAGEITTINATRLGNFALLAEHGPVAWDGKLASDFPRLPKEVPTSADTAGIVTGQAPAVIDPSRGDIYKQLADNPTLSERFAHGGIVGKIIAGLFAIGMIIALYRAVVLTTTEQKIKKQLKSPEAPTDNPLGRVLGVYNSEKQLHVEALELRLLESIMDEQQHLERGLSMLKLLAALAPMLGLLGTVTGMIETFQVITQFGNAEPRVMAGGISMALVTTVLGLITAMPLLLAHNLLSSKAEAIRNVLERQSVGLVAQQAEAQTTESKQAYAA
ncbi:MotA/TolQ/ExbB proton channel family protein [Vibrio sp. SCSIO 43140]|uniref:MotA/TolQ/ExbB proton channel family protein n=1 Tax=Vibrio sp. SCSIO 43140 TaxID=2819100 RepID=UPI002074C246|nr:MotA/TolQ/ExbB proton channel family protein [Vibrio sp. SCSIO 43140]USD59968.1 MotA/TolQ/ExbB proton channel family protein [Vibrio sp. SCSIO 43140]